LAQWQSTSRTEYESQIGTPVKTTEKQGYNKKV
jgi:hypothetical protein